MCCLLWPLALLGIGEPLRKQTRRSVDADARRNRYQRVFTHRSNPGFVAIASGQNAETTSPSRYSRRSPPQLRGVKFVTPTEKQPGPPCRILCRRSPLAARRSSLVAVKAKAKNLAGAPGLDSFLIGDTVSIQAVDATVVRWWSYETTCNDAGVAPLRSSSRPDPATSIHSSWR